MAAPKGNRNGRGTKGRSGRKSAYQEHADQQYLMDLWFNKHTKDEIRELLNEAGEHSMADAWLAKGLAGNVYIQKAIFNKLFPDMTNLNLGLVKPLPTDKADSKLKKLYGIDNFRKKGTNVE